MVKTPEELALELKTDIANAEKAKSELQALITKAEASNVEAVESKDQLTKAETKIADLESKLSDLYTKVGEDNLKGKKAEETMSLKDAIVKTLTKDDFKFNETYELKASTADVVAPIYNTQMMPGLQTVKSRNPVFIPEFNVNYVGQDKKTIAWLEGALASVIGYTSEAVGATNTGTVGVVEKSRELAKITAKIKVTAEMYEDANIVASKIQTEMYQKALLWLDGELYSGIGADGTNKNKIYGLTTHATAFSATKAGVATSFVAPTLTDLFESIKLQGLVVDAAETNTDAGFAIDTIFINPIDATKWRGTKDKNDNYLLNRLADGSQIMGGLRVVESKAVKANSLLAMESGLAELWIKRNFEMKVGQEEKDFSNDMYTIVLFMRGQALVQPTKKAGVIKVDNITTALTSIAKVASA